MEMRPATREDLDALVSLYEGAHDFMRRNGNPTQWAGEYPSGSDILADVRRGTLFACEDEGQVVGCLCLQPGPDPTYLKIEDGAWLDDGPYFVIHRLAVREPGRGVGGFCLDWALQSATSLRADTHRDNVPMQRLLASRGFQHCGTIHVRDGSPRMAYQLVVPGQGDDGGWLSWLPWRRHGLMG